MTIPRTFSVPTAILLFCTFALLSHFASSFTTSLPARAYLYANSRSYTHASNHLPPRLDGTHELGSLLKRHSLFRGHLYKNGDDEGNTKGSLVTRRDALHAWTAASLGGLTAISDSGRAVGVDTQSDKLSYFQRFPTLFAPLYGNASRRTMKRQIFDNVWALEQNLELGPLEVPLRCVVIRLKDGTLWVHAPLAPTEEFFELVESCSLDGGPAGVAHVIIPTYALEHKVFAKDALQRWQNAKLWTAPGQFSFPVRNAADDYIWGKAVNGVLSGSDLSNSDIPWTNEIQYETLSVGTFSIAGTPVTLYETAFYHTSSKTLIVTDSVEQVPLYPPELNNPEKLLLISKRSTADPFPDDTPESRQIGWEKTALLVSYFFPEHEELDPDSGFGVVTWTDGWHDNFNALAGRLICPPVVRTLLYRQNPADIRTWVNRVVGRWEFNYIIPAHFEAPIRSSPQEFQRAFAFLEDENIDAFPANDLARGLKPIADIVYKSLV